MRRCVRSHNRTATCSSALTHKYAWCVARAGNRVGIMVGGRMRCLGTIQHLKDRFGQGYLAEVGCLAIPTLSLLVARC